MSDALVVITTTETAEDGERLARVLVESELAACVQVIPRITSIYRWQGRVEQADEALLLIKTTRGAYAALADAIKRNHGYQTPEIIALPVETGETEYLAWLAAAVKIEAQSEPRNLDRIDGMFQNLQDSSSRMV